MEVIERRVKRRGEKEREREGGGRKGGSKDLLASSEQHPKESWSGRSRDTAAIEPWASQGAAWVPSAR